MANANAIVTMLVGAVILAAGVHAGDAGATGAGAMVYLGGLHWPRPYARRSGVDRRLGGQLW